MGKVEVSSDISESLLHFLLQNYKNHRLKHGVVNPATEKFKISRASVKSILTRTKETINVSSRKKRSCSRKKLIAKKI